jgi:hypothetical protein
MHEKVTHNQHIIHIIEFFFFLGRRYSFLPAISFRKIILVLYRKKKIHLRH